MRGRRVFIAGVIASTGIVAGLWWFHARDAGPVLPRERAGETRKEPAPTREAHEEPRTDPAGDERSEPAPPASGSIRGHVYLHGPPLPALGVQVLAALDGACKSAGSAVTDASGAYEIPGLAAGRYRVWASSDGWATGHLSHRDLAVQVDAGRATEDVDRVLVPVGFVTGLVLSADSKRPIEGLCWAKAPKIPGVLQSVSNCITLHGMKSVRLGSDLERRLELASKLSGKPMSELLREAAGKCCDEVIGSSLDLRLADVIGSVRGRGGSSRKTGREFTRLLKSRRKRRVKR